MPLFDQVLFPIRVLYLVDSRVEHWIIGLIITIATITFVATSITTFSTLLAVSFEVTFVAITFLIHVDL